MHEADMVLLSGKIYSVSADDKTITGEAIAVQDGYIRKIGDNDSVKAYIGDETIVINCDGKTILPGLCDAHCHP